MWECLEGGQCRGCVSASLPLRTSLCGMEEGRFGEGDIFTSVSLSLHLTVSFSTCHHISLFYFGLHVISLGSLCLFSIFCLSVSVSLDLLLPPSLSLYTSS